MKALLPLDSHAAYRNVSRDDIKTEDLFEDWLNNSPIYAPCPKCRQDRVVVSIGDEYFCSVCVNRRNRAKKKSKR